MRLRDTMEQLTVHDFRSLSGSDLRNNAFLRPRITGVTTDSRKARQGELFIALRGEKFDGHEFVFDAISKGVQAIIVDALWAEKNAAKIDALPAGIIVVPDSTMAFGELAGMYRQKFSIPVIAVGGSNGKTTTKELISAALGKKFSVLRTEGNLNNHIGVPSMIFRLRKKHDCAVLELGTNHFGEMKYLSGIVRPTHVLITNIGREHLEFFGNVKGVMAEEIELFHSLGSRGTAFVNMSDPALAKTVLKKGKKIHFGSRLSPVKAKNIRLNESGNAQFDLVVKGRKSAVPVVLGASGYHAVSNALGAAAVALHFKVPLPAIVAALGECAGASQRMEIVKQNGITILNDTYNANPDSTLAALHTLSMLTHSGKKIAVLADMLELGAHGEEEHRSIGKALDSFSVDAVLTYGTLAASISSAAGKIPARHFENKEELAAELKNITGFGDAVLVKGSRGMKMEEVVSALIPGYQSSHH